MNAPVKARISWEDFRSTVWPLFRNAPAEEIEMRARLLLIRDLSLGALGYASEEAWHLLKAISEMAGRYALEPITLDQLKEMRRVLVMASAAANSMQVLMNDIHHQSPPAATDQEAEGARG